MSNIEYMPHNCEWNTWIAEHDKQIRADVIDSIIQAKKNKFFCVEDLCDESKNCNDCEIRYLQQLKEQTNA